MQATDTERAAPWEVPFISVEEAWLWCVAGLTLRAEGARLLAGAAGVARPCEPIDILNTADRLRRLGLLSPPMIRVLLVHGRRQTPPDPASPGEAADARLWQAALDRMETPLIAKGIVAAPAPEGRCRPAGAAE